MKPTLSTLFSLYTGLASASIIPHWQPHGRTEAPNNFVLAGRPNWGMGQGSYCPGGMVSAQERTHLSITPTHGHYDADGRWDDSDGGGDADRAANSHANLSSPAWSTPANAHDPQLPRPHDALTDQVTQPDWYDPSERQKHRNDKPDSWFQRRLHRLGREEAYSRHPVVHHVFEVKRWVAAVRKRDALPMPLPLPLPLPMPEAKNPEISDDVKFPYHPPGGNFYVYGVCSYGNNRCQMATDSNEFYIPGDTPRGCCNPFAPCLQEGDRCRALRGEDWFGPNANCSGPGSGMDSDMADAYS